VHRVRRAHGRESPPTVTSESKLAHWTSRGSTMAMQDPQAEPSMEEILASIRRIISEEEQPASEPVLDLTQHEPAAPAAEDDIVLEAVEQAVAATPAPAPTARQTPAPVETSPAPPEPAILSTPTTHAAAGSLARLAGSLRIADTNGQTVEGV